MSANVDDVVEQLQPLVDGIGNPLRRSFAQMRLDFYGDAARAYANVIASAAASYSDIAGSVSKRAVDEAKAAMESAWADFCAALEAGGVSAPALGDDGVGYWNLI